LHEIYFVFHPWNERFQSSKVAASTDHLSGEKDSDCQEEHQSSHGSHSYKRRGNANTAFRQKRPSSYGVDAYTDPYNSQADCSVEQEEDEVLVIVPADAISNPRAVMIHPFNASIAQLTMMHSW
jgi:hypothetical protein